MKFDNSITKIGLIGFGWHHRLASGRKSWNFFLIQTHRTPINLHQIKNCHQTYIIKLIKKLSYQI